MKKRKGISMKIWSGDEIKALRKRYEETQEEFCRRLAISIDGLRAWEQDRGSPNGPAHLLLSRLEEDFVEGKIRDYISA